MRPASTIRSVEADGLRCVAGGIYSLVIGHYRRRKGWKQGGRGV